MDKFDTALSLLDEAYLTSVVEPAIGKATTEDNKTFYFSENIAKKELARRATQADAQTNEETV